MEEKKRFKLAPELTPLQRFFTPTPIDFYMVNHYQLGELKKGRSVGFANSMCITLFTIALSFFIAIMTTSKYTIIWWVLFSVMVASIIATIVFAIKWHQSSTKIKDVMSEIKAQEYVKMKKDENDKYYFEA